MSFVPLGTHQLNNILAKENATRIFQTLEELRRENPSFSIYRLRVLALGVQTESTTPHRVYCFVPARAVAHARPATTIAMAVALKSLVFTGEEVDILTFDAHVCTKSTGWDTVADDDSAS